MLLDKATYDNSATCLARVKRFNCWLTAISIFFVMLILVLSICVYWSYFMPGLMLRTISYNASLFLQILCMLGWAWTLVSLYRNVKHSEKLLPNRRLFHLHGCLLAGYLLIFALAQLLWYWINHTDDLNTYLTLRGILDITMFPETALEFLSFFLVVKLMLPVTPTDKETRSKFQRFLFKGFANKDELHAAVLANNPDMTIEQRAFMEHDLDQLNSLIESA